MNTLAPGVARVMVIVVMAGCYGGHARAQQIIHEWHGAFTFSGFGGIVTVGVGDANGDGTADVLVSSYVNADGGADPGKVQVFSGKDGAILWEAQGTTPDEEFGRSAAGAGDVNLDGFADLLVGVPSAANSTGTVRVLSGPSGAILMELHGEAARDAFGAAVTGGEDLDGDGHPELLVTAPYSDRAGPN